MNDVTIRAGRRDDAAAILQLHITVAADSGMLARMPDEIDAGYIDDVLGKSLDDGVFLVAESGGRVIGELHAYRMGLRKFAHVLGSLTVAVHPDAQGKGVGRKLFEALFREVRANWPQVSRVELYTQQSNTRGQRLYESLGFRPQGRSEKAILGPDGKPEDDIPMAWFPDG